VIPGSGKLQRRPNKHCQCVECLGGERRFASAPPRYRWPAGLSDARVGHIALISSRIRHAEILEILCHVGDSRHSLTQMLDFLRLQFALLANGFHGSDHAEL
jgi:hypothetical protein